MTHDELSIEVNRRLQVALYNGDIPAIHALRAVVELHKPESNRMPFCVACRGVWQGEIDVVLYPCDTIQAIEKELNNG
jgi:hypothetical protein